MSDDRITRWIAAAVNYGDFTRQVEGLRPGEDERAEIAAHLRAANVTETDIEWMTDSCPSLSTAQRLYPLRNP